MYSDNLKIDEINSEDIEQVVELQKICYRENFWEDKKVFEILLSVYPKGAIKALYQEQLSGYIFFHPYIYNKIKPLNYTLELKGNENCMHLHDLCIHPSYRGLGLSKLFLDSFDSETKLMGFKYQTLVAVQGSEKMWSKYGFQVSKVINYGSESAYYMTRIF